MWCSVVWCSGSCSCIAVSCCCRVVSWTSKSGPSMCCFLTCLLRNGLRATKHHKALFRHLNCQKWSETVQPIPALRNLTSKCASYHKGVHFWNISTSKSAPGMVRFALRNVFCTTTAWTFWTSQLTKSFQTRSVFNIVASKRASRHNGVHFLNISSNSALGMVCFAHFDFEMCFSPQWRILFPHFNFQECSENGVFCTYYWLENAFGATRGVHFFISHLTRWLRTCRFSEPTFDPPEPQKLGKT